MAIETLSGWLEREGLVPAEGAGAIADVGRVRTFLVAAARRGQAVGYSGLLNLLGYWRNQAAPA